MATKCNQKCKSDPILKTLLNAFHCVSRSKKKYDHLNKCQKCTWLNWISWFLLKEELDFLHMISFQMMKHLKYLNQDQEKDYPGST